METKSTTSLVMQNTTGKVINSELTEKSKNNSHHGSSSHSHLQTINPEINRYENIDLTLYYEILKNKISSWI